MTVPSSSQGGNPLKEIREFLGLSQDRFAALLGSTKTTVGRRERGESIPQLTLHEIARLEEALAEVGKTIGDFVPKESRPS